MLTRLATLFLFTLNTACYAEPPGAKNTVDEVAATSTPTVTLPNCAITEADIHVIAEFEGAKLRDQKTGVDSDSREPLLVQTFAFDNGDVAVAEQKYCDMYNLGVSYRLATLDKEKFQKGLDNIDLLIPLVNQDYKLKAPLKLVVDMLMNQQQLSLEQSFDIALPDQVVVSTTSVEHSLAFRPVEGAGAQLNFYFGIGVQ